MGKKYVAGITEKRLRNRRFRRTEDAILRVFFEKNVYIGAKEMAMKVGVARSTFYHHHKTVEQIMPDYKRYILRKYTRMANGAIKRNGCEIGVIYWKTLIFIMQNQVVFEMFLRCGDENVVREMIMKIEVDMMRKMRLSRGMRRVFMIYVGEVVELINEWCRDGFNEKEIGKLLDGIVYLTNTAKKRLGPIV